MKGDPPQASRTADDNAAAGTRAADHPLERDDDAADIEALRALFLDEAGGYLRRMDDAFAALAAAAVDPGYVAGAEVDNLFRALHTLKGAAGSVGNDGIALAAHEMEDTVAELRAGDLLPTAGILEGLKDDISALRAMVEGARNASARQAHAVNESRPVIERRKRTDRRFIGDRRSDERGVHVEARQLDTLLDTVGDLVILRTRLDRRVGELEGLRRDLRVTRAAMRRALNRIGIPEAAIAAEGSSPMAQVDPERRHERTLRALGRLSDLELELATALSHLERTTLALVGEGDTLRRTTERLDETVRTARLVRMDWIYHRLAAALRETTSPTGQRVDLVTAGGELELDKSILERLYDPMVHLLRNALAHGIEPPEARRAAGKPEAGRIEITARIESDFVYLQFSDDGRGVDREAAQRALIKQGRLSANAHLDGETLIASLFEMGVSTRSEADAMAGRGMGLDVVKNTALNLGGDVTCETESGRGTTFRLSFPLVTAITEALLFKVGGQVYAVPSSQVIEALPPTGADLPFAFGGSSPHEVQLQDGRTVPVLRLQGLFGVEIPPDHRTASLHVRHGKRSFVLTVDRLIGPRTIVIRPLGAILGRLPYYAGVTISGTGKVQLVLDLGALSEAAHAPPHRPRKPVRRGPPRILVADDSRLAREAAARGLSGSGWQAVTAEDGLEAWEMLNERRFDVLVTDLEMPRVDGFELLARIRREATLKGLPIIVMTSRTSRAIRDRALRLGARMVIPKGPNRRALILAVSGLLTQRSG